MRTRQRAQRREEPLPVISLFAELLLEVAQGQALSLQHPPVWNFFSTEKVGDNQLAGLECVDACQFLRLFVTEKEIRMPQTQQIRTDTHTARGLQRRSGRNPHVTEGETSKEICRAQGRRGLSSGCKLTDTTPLNAFHLGCSEASFWLTSNNPAPTSKDQRRDSTGKTACTRLAETREYHEGNPRPGLLTDSVCSNASEAYPSCPQNHITGGQPVTHIPGWPQT